MSGLRWSCHFRKWLERAARLRGGADRLLGRMAGALGLSGLRDRGVAERGRSGQRGFGVSGGTARFVQRCQKSRITGSCRGGFAGRGTGRGNSASIEQHRAMPRRWWTGEGRHPKAVCWRGLRKPGIYSGFLVAGGPVCGCGLCCCIRQGSVWSGITRPDRLFEVCPPGDPSHVRRHQSWPGSERAGPCPSLWFRYAGRCPFRFRGR